MRLFHMFASCLGTLGVITSIAACAPAGGPAPEPRSPPHVVIVVVDTLRADGIDIRGDGRAAPFFHRFAETATVFHQARSNASWTLPSHASILTGLLPSRHDVHWRNRLLSVDHPTLAQRLAEAGYGSLALVENAWLDSRFGVTRGFDRVTLATIDYFDRVEPDSDDIVLKLVAAVEEIDWSRPQLLLINIVDVHAPSGLGFDRFEISEPERYICRAHDGREDDLVELRRLYQLDVVRASKKLDLMLGLIGGKIDLEEALVVVTSDHGEHLGEQGLVSHHFSVYESLLRVPLLVHLPGQTERRDVEAPVSLVDLTPSILQAIGLDSEGSDGESIFDGTDGHPHFAEYVEPDSAETGSPEQLWVDMTTALRKHCPQGSEFHGDFFTLIDEDGTKVIASSDGRRMLFDLGREGGEVVDLATERRERLRGLASRLPRVRVTTEGAEGEEPPPEVLEQLRTLGYID